MEKTDWAVVWATFAGPIIAVLTTVWLERRRRTNDRREGVALTLLNSQASDASFQEAINAIQLLFTKDRDVIDKWDAYITAAAAQSATDELIQALQKSLLKAVGFREDRAAKTVRSRLVTNGYVRGRQQQSDALEAVVRVAAAAERSATASEAIVARMYETQATT